MYKQDLALGCKIHINGAPVNIRDRVGILVYMGKRSGKAKAECFISQDEAGQFEEALAAGRVQPSNVLDLHRKRSVRPIYIIGPCIIRVNRIHKQTKKPLKPRYFSRELSQIVVIGLRPVDRMELLVGFDDG